MCGLLLTLIVGIGLFYVWDGLLLLKLLDLAKEWGQTELVNGFRNAGDACLAILLDLNSRFWCDIHDSSDWQTWNRMDEEAFYACEFSIEWLLFSVGTVAWVLLVCLLCCSLPLPHVGTACRNLVRLLRCSLPLPESIYQDDRRVKAEEWTGLKVQEPVNRTFLEYIIC